MAVMLKKQSNIRQSTIKSLKTNELFLGSFPKDINKSRKAQENSTLYQKKS